MQTFFSLILLCAAVAHTWAQDTTRVSVSSCIENVLKSGNTVDGRSLTFRYADDSLYISGQIGANCGSSHIAIVSRRNDTLFISTKDTGMMATCTCLFNFSLTIQASATDSLVNFNGTIYHTNKSLTNIRDLNEAFVSINPNPVLNFLTLTTADSSQPVMVYINDLTGKSVHSSSIVNSSTLDVSFLKPGLYILQIKMEGNKIIQRKLVKK